MVAYGRPQATAPGARQEMDYTKVIRASVPCRKHSRIIQTLNPRYWHFCAAFTTEPPAAAHTTRQVLPSGKRGKHRRLIWMNQSTWKEIRFAE